MIIRTCLLLTGVHNERGKGKEREAPTRLIKNSNLPMLHMLLEIGKPQSM